MTIDLKKFDQHMKDTVRAYFDEDGEPIALRVMQELSELDLGGRLDYLNSMLVEAFMARIDTHHNHSRDEVMRAMGGFVQEGMFMLAMATGYRMGNRDAAELIDDAASTFAALFSGEADNG